MLSRQSSVLSGQFEPPTEEGDQSGTRTCPDNRECRDGSWQSCQAAGNRGRALIPIHVSGSEATSLHNIDRIARDVRKENIIFPHLSDELIDHLCCDVEQEMAGGLHFPGLLPVTTSVS